MSNCSGPGNKPMTEAAACRPMLNRDQPMQQCACQCDRQMPGLGKGLNRDTQQAHLKGRQGEVDGVKGEVAPALHVVDVPPHDIQGDPRSRVIIYHLLHLPDAAVAIPAQHQASINIQDSHRKSPSGAPPHDVQRDAGRRVIVDHFLHLPDAAVAIPAQAHRVYCKCCDKDGSLLAGTAHCHT